MKIGVNYKIVQRIESVGLHSLNEVDRLNMNLKVLPLKMLVSRQVVGNKMDYSAYLNGTTKEELDQLKRMTGHFKIESCELSIVGNEQPENEHDWEEVKEYLKENLKDDTAGGLVNVTDNTGAFSIYEKEENGRRFWLVSDVDGKEKHFLSNASSWEETYSERIERQDFIEDGKLVHTTKRAEINNEGKMELVFDLYVSFTLDSQGNVIRESIYYLPKKNIEITIVMWTLRCDREGQTEFNKCTCNLFTIFGHLPRCLAFRPSAQ